MEKTAPLTKSPRPRWQSLAKRLSAGVVAGYFGIVGTLYFFQGNLMYPGSSLYRHLRLEDPKILDVMEEVGMRVWRDGNGRYQGFCREDPAAKEAWLIFYGNGDHAARSASYYFTQIPRNLPGRAMSYFVMEYPGYGPRGGVPAQEVLIEAAQEAFEAVKARYPVVYVLGQSLGSGVASQIAGLFPREVAGLVLLTPFDRMATSAKAQVAGWFGPAGMLVPTALLIRDRYESLEALKAYRGPLVVICGGRDTLTSAAGAKKLAEQAGDRGRFWVQEENGHWADLEPVPPCRELFAFATTAGLQQEKP